MDNNILLAAHHFVESMLGRADGALDFGTSPFWHGWALQEAFFAGVAWQKTHAKDLSEKRREATPSRLDTSQPACYRVGDWFSSPPPEVRLGLAAESRSPSLGRTLIFPQKILQGGCRLQAAEEWEVEPRRLN
mgnify:CR=1 FL=1